MSKATVVNIRAYDWHHLATITNPPFIYVGRSVGLLGSHPLANPFRIGKRADLNGRKLCLKRYEEWLDSDEDNETELHILAQQVRLTDRPLACWCGVWPKEEGLLCHAVLLAKRVNEILGEG